MITEDRWRMSRSQLPLLVSAGSDLIFLHWTSLYPGQHVSSLTAQHDAVSRLTVGLKIIHKTCACPEESRRREDRMCEGPGTALPSQGIGWVVFIRHRDSVIIRHTQSHTLPQILAERAIYTHKLCSHPPLPLIQCSNPMLFCNTVTQSHQLFIKGFCTCSVMGLIDREIELKGEEVKNWYNFLKLNETVYLVNYSIVMLSSVHYPWLSVLPRSVSVHR